MTLKKTHDQKGISSFTIVKILKTFSSKELIEFEKLLTSPYFNNHSTVIILFRELKNHYPDFVNKDLSKEYLFGIINKGKKYDDKLFQKYLSRLNKLAEDFLNLIQMRTDSCSKEINVLYQLSKRDLNEVYSRRLNEFEKTMENDIKLTEDYFLIKHKLCEIKYYHNSRRNNVNPLEKELLESYNNLINYFVFNSGYYINQLTSDRYSFRMPDQLKSRGTFFDNEEIERNLIILIENAPTDNGNSKVFLELILNDMRMQSGSDPLSAYNRLTEIVNKNSEKLSDELLLFYIKRMIVYCIIENSTGVMDMSREILENYKFLLEKKLFHIEGVPDLRLLDYRTILFTALRLNEMECVENFIYEGKNLIKEESRDNVFNFGYSVLLFHKKNYSGALDHISMIRNESFPITLDVYILKTKIFYEMEFYDSALSMADSLRHFIKGNKLISDIMANNLKNFYKYFRSLLNLRVKHTESKKDKLLIELKEGKLIRDKKWLIDKLEELSSGKMLKTLS